MGDESVESVEIGDRPDVEHTFSCITGNGIISNTARRTPGTITARYIDRRRSRHRYCRSARPCLFRPVRDNESLRISLHRLGPRYCDRARGLSAQDTPITKPEL